MKEGHIFIYGEIASFQGEDAKDFGFISLKNVTDQINGQSDAEKLIVHIHSPGGDVNEGFAIHDALIATGKQIKTIGEGMVGSIATVPFLAGSEREMTPNAEFFIHNPWGGMTGDAEEMQRYADGLKKAQTKLADFYASKTGQKVEDLSAKMDTDTYLTSDEAVSLGFATAISEPLKAVAKITIKKKKTKNTDMSELKNLLTKLAKKLNLTDEGNKYTLQDGTVIETENEIAVGQTVSANGTPLADGDHSLDNGTIVSVQAGKITNLVKPDAPDTDALTQEIAALKAENATLKETNEKQAADIEEVKEDVKALAKLSSTYVPKSEIKGFKKDGEPEKKDKGLAVKEAYAKKKAEQVKK